MVPEMVPETYIVVRRKRPACYCPGPANTYSTGPWAVQSLQVEPTLGNRELQVLRLVASSGHSEGHSCLAVVGRTGKKKSAPRQREPSVEAATA